jgi:class 3 adenylate cyclase
MIRLFERKPVDPRLAAVFRQEERNGLRAAMIGRTIALIVIGLWLGLTRNYPQNVAIVAVVLAFVCLGQVHLQLIGSRFDFPWVKYLFAALDAVLLCFCIIYTDIDVIAPGLEPVMLYRFGVLPWLFLLIAAAAFAYSPGLVVWTGLTTIIAWMVPYVIIVEQMDYIVDWRDLPTGADAEAFKALFFNENFIGRGSRFQEIIALLLVTLLVAMATRRARGIVQRQAEGERERQIVSRTFGRYVPQAVAESLIAGDGTLEPVQRDASVLFVDIEKFTTIAEALPPSSVVDMLNDYFDAVSDAIVRHGGVINQFQGDAVLATFNVPVEDENHARNAVQAALAICGAVQGRSFAGQNLNVRVGVNTGPLVAGSVGSRGRQNYTVHGDAVNLAARLESMNKEFGTRILLSEVTVGLAGDGFAFRQVGEAEVRGKTGRVRLFTVAD